MVEVFTGLTWFRGCEVTIDMGRNAQKETFVPIELKPCQIKVLIEKRESELRATFLRQIEGDEWIDSAGRCWRGPCAQDLVLQTVNR